MKNYWLQQRTLRLQKQEEVTEAKKFWDDFSMHMAIKKNGGNPKYQKKMIKAEICKIDLSGTKHTAKELLDAMEKNRQKNVIHSNGSKRQLLNSIAKPAPKWGQERPKPKNYQEAVQMFDAGKKEIAQREEETKTVKESASKKFLSNDHFQRVLSDYLTGNPNDWIAASEVTYAFEILANSILDAFGPKLFAATNRDDAIQECVMVSSEKLHRYSDAVKSNANVKAFNYFTTVMLGHLRGLYQKKKRLTNPAK
jgi:hypothetical protein